jgi:hypothetical protein
LQLVTIPIFLLVEVLAPFVDVQTAYLCQLSRANHVSVGIFQPQEGTTLTVLFLVVIFYTVFLASIQTSLPATKKTDHQVWAHLATLIARTVSEVPVEGLGKIYDSDLLMSFPLYRVLLDVFIKQFI